MKAKILYVEDDRAHQDLIRAYLGSHVELTVVSNKEEFDRLADSFSLIICDGQIVGWPNHFDEVVKKFSCEVVMFSSLGLSDLNAFVQKGARAVFQKNPDDTKKLVSFIKSLVN